MSSQSLQDLAYLTSTAPGEHDRVAAHRPDEPLRWSLDGTWRFHFSPTVSGAPADAAEVDLDDSGWESIELPNHYVLTDDGRWGRPIYTNVKYPIPLDPPDVPDQNATGDHRLSFWLPGAEQDVGDLPKPGANWVDWNDFERVLLRFDGLESIALVHLNGQRVGVVRGSRLRTELDITDLLRPGRNVLHVRVHQWSAMTYVEDQDQWWLPGIFRSVSLVGRPVGGIDDLWLDADFDPASSHGWLRPEIVAAKPAWPITISIDELGFEQTYESADELVNTDLGEVTAWDCDNPQLYTARVQATGESVELRIGFRNVQIAEREFLVNGWPLRMRGVNRHEFDADRGRIVPLDRARADLIMMKQHGMNTVRTSHYPPAPEFLDLCDELGLFVVLENDLETHGFEIAGWVGNPTDDPDWHDHLVDRMRRTVERDKNHPSIILWSLGNESGTGANLAAMSNWTHRRDPSRPVHYEGDHAGAYTDIVSRMYTPLEGLEDLSNGVGDAATGTPAQASRLLEQPIMLCEYVHAMGNGPGGVGGYEDVMEAMPGIFGALVWEWRDHGLRTTINGTSDYGYGGDFGEDFHDATFVIDGLTTPDARPSPGMAEVAAHFTPIRIELDYEYAEIINLRHSADTSDLRFVVVIDGPSGEIGREFLDIAPIEAGEAVEVVLPSLAPADEECWISVIAELAEDAAWAPAGHVLARAQLVVPPDTDTPVMRAGPRPEQLDGWQVGPVTIDPQTGRVARWAGQDLAEADVTLWRAPTSNDSLRTHGSYELADPVTTRGMGVQGPSSADRWRAAGLDRMMSRLVDIRHEGDAITVRRRVAAAQATAGVEVIERWTQVGDRANLAIDMAPFGRFDCTWPRAGWHLLLPAGYTDASWVGRGPGEAYPDTDAGSWLGSFAAAIDDLSFGYVVPQESGHRPGLRRLEISGEQLPTLEVVATSQPGFTLTRHDAHELARAGHRSELPDSRGVHLYLDAAQHGIGTRSCGPDVRPEYQLWAKAMRIDVSLGVVR